MRKASNQANNTHLILLTDFSLFSWVWIASDTFTPTCTRTLCTLWRTHRPINFQEPGVLNLVEGQTVVPAEWLVIKGSWAAAEEKATHQPLVGLDANDGNLWFTLLTVRVHCAASSRTFPPRRSLYTDAKKIKGLNEDTLGKTRLNVSYSCHAEVELRRG